MGIDETSPIAVKFSKKTLIAVHTLKSQVNGMQINGSVEIIAADKYIGDYDYPTVDVTFKLLKNVDTITQRYSKKTSRKLMLEKRRLKQA